MLPSPLPTSFAPAPVPTAVPVPSPTAVPAPAPTAVPAPAPTAVPAPAPTALPDTPSDAPVPKPTSLPTLDTDSDQWGGPTKTPTPAPTRDTDSDQRGSPTKTPTSTPTAGPSYAPTVATTYSPTTSPTLLPTFAPTIEVTATPTATPDAPSNVVLLSPPELEATFVVHWEDDNVEANYVVEYPRPRRNLGRPVSANYPRRRPGAASTQSLWIPTSTSWLRCRRDPSLWTPASPRGVLAGTKSATATLSASTAARR